MGRHGSDCCKWNFTMIKFVYRHLLEDSQLIAEVYLLGYIILNGNCSSALDH